MCCVSVVGVLCECCRCVVRVLSVCCVSVVGVLCECRRCVIGSAVVDLSACRRLYLGELLVHSIATTSVQTTDAWCWMQQAYTAWDGLT